jgi:hypothetical protein
MAGYIFKDVTITIFDINTTISPHLLEPSKGYREKYRLLEYPDIYNEFYVSRNRVSSENFEFDRLPRVYLKEGNFWKSYISNTDPKKADYWNLYVPLVGHPKRSVFGLTLPPGISMKHKLKIYLSPLGWSTIVWSRLIGDVEKNQLIDIMGKLTGKAFQGRFSVKDFPYFIDGEQMGRSSFFRHFQNLLFKEVFTEDNSLHTGMKIPRYFVVSVNEFEGDIVKFNEMLPGIQAIMLSILFGEKLSAGHVVRKDHPQILKTYISGPNFALTNFEHGTFLFTQREAGNPQMTRKALCLANNITEFTIMALSLFNFYKFSKHYEKEDRLAELKEQSKSNLQRIKNEYENQFCQNFLRSHKGIKSIL